MVKGYDPTKNDPSKIMLQYLLRWTQTDNPLSLDEAQKYTKYWLKSSEYTSTVYKKFNLLYNENVEVEKPQIILKKNCKGMIKGFSWSMILEQNNLHDQNYPAYCDGNKINICLNYITNKTELKQNLDRELTILLKKSQALIKKNKQQNNKQPLNINANQQSLSNDYQREVENRDKQLVSIIYEGCRQSYKNYLLQPQIEQRLSKKCTKYLFFRRTERKLPWDIKFRYAAKILEQVL